MEGTIMGNENDEIRDYPNLLKMYREAVEELKDERDKRKTLEATNADLTKKLETKPEEVESEWKKKAIASEAKAALNATGVKDADRFFKYLDLSNVDYDEEGQLVGLDDAVTTITTDFADVFDPKKRVGGKADIHTKGATEHVMTASEIAAAQLGL
jgi:uncharacterized protein (UPF0264 family)